VIENAIVYLVEFFRQMLPWSLPALLALAVDWRGSVACLREQKSTLLFAGGWILLFYVVFVAGNIQRTRYFMPVYPFLGLLFATLLLNAWDSAAGCRWVQGTARLIFWLGIVGAIGLTGLGWLASPVVTLGGLALAGGLLVVWQFWTRLPIAQRLALASGWIILAFAVNLLFIVPAFVFSPAPELVQFCRSSPAVRGKHAIPMIGVDRGYRSQVRALSGGEFIPVMIPPEQRERALSDYGFIICSDKVLEDWQLSGARIEKCATGSAEWKARDYLALLRAQDRQAVRSARKTEYFLVTSGQ
jgi:hypothetical protein